MKHFTELTMLMLLSAMAAGAIMFSYLMLDNSFVLAMLGD